MSAWPSIAPPRAPSPTKTILVIGATGKQGSGMVSSLVSANRLAKPQQPLPYRVLALTRTPHKNEGMKQLPGVEVVQGDLNDEAGMEAIFSGEGMGGIWGVFMCLAFPGLGKPADSELAQGKLAANLALKYQVQHFIYASSEQGGDSESGPSPSHVAKMVIEQHIRELGRQYPGFRWTILRPAFFYENFDGVLGAVSETLLASSVQKGTKIQMVASEDVGPVARAVFEAGEEYMGKSMTVCGDCLSPQEVNAVHKKVTGRPLSRIPGFIGSALYGMNAHAKNLVMHMERVHQLRLQDPAGYTANGDAAKRAYPGMLTFESWMLSKGKVRGGKREKGWNNLTINELVKGTT
ncbi:NADP-binding protein [Dacryopinax primogenitus]|uniref:NADP-binding protein n=1 Tax=Dacryopinax primogenitus (strain DJM 731) TaxID=1858805 RepID=M5FV75_DACPD|nr:NADP-binding protein [Dacryopinax primogenitus]EJT99509.1 NADP-binding protein [Dacryopinax primogenitus]